MRKKVVPCTTCKKSAVRSGTSFTFMAGGTYYTDFLNPSFKKATAYLDFGVHGAHSGGFDTTSAIEHVIGEERSDQFELVFCSPTCLRRFLNAAVDSLEKKLKKKSTKTGKTAKRNERKKKA